MGSILCSSAISLLLVVCSAQRMWFSVAEDRDVNTHCYYTDGEHMHVAWGVWLIKLQLMQKSRTRNANPLPTFQSKPCALICLVPDIYSTDHPPHNALQSRSFRLQDNMQPKSLRRVHLAAISLCVPASTYFTLWMMSQTLIDTL